MLLQLSSVPASLLLKLLLLLLLLLLWPASATSLQLGRFKRTNAAIAATCCRV
jgi:hypothetical protein